MNRRALAHHGLMVALAATTLDWAYTLHWWWIKGRPHAARHYFGTLTILASETVVIIHLVRALRRIA